MATLKRIEFLALVVLASGPLHGYGIVQEIERVSDGAVRPRPGNVYRVLDRLIERGLLAEADLEPVVEGGAERRRFYRITAAGRREARAEAALLMQVVDASPAIRDSLDGAAS